MVSNGFVAINESEVYTTYANRYFLRFQGKHKNNSINFKKIKKQKLKMTEMDSIANRIMSTMDRIDNKIALFKK